MKLLFKLHWPDCLGEIITIQPPSLLCRHCGSITSLRASCVTLQNLPRYLIYTLKLLLQTRVLIIKIFSGNHLRTGQAADFVTVHALSCKCPSPSRDVWAIPCGLLICQAVCRNWSSSPRRRQNSGHREMKTQIQEAIGHYYQASLLETALRRKYM